MDALLRGGAAEGPIEVRLSGPSDMGAGVGASTPAITTPDGRYIVVRGRLWRATNPDLQPEQRRALVRALMDARRALKRGNGPQDRAVARARVEEAKRGLGERGPVWWCDGAPDYNRRLAKNTPYAAWWLELNG